MVRPAFSIAGADVAHGPVNARACNSWKRHGPRMFVSAAVHGDELNGMEIIRQLLA